MTKVEHLIEKGIELGASDFHFKSFYPPAYRVKKRLVVLEDEFIDDKDLLGFIEEHIENKPEDLSDFDTAFEVAGYRFRASIFFTEKTPAMVLRKLPKDIPQLDKLNLPQLFIDYLFDEEGKLKIHKGLILITGETNSGKSTTLASLIKKAIENNPLVVITLEDPIEYKLYPENQNSIVYQREIGKDTESFARGLKSALREDPDMILVGEIRDVETMKTALNASMTGHIVLATLHTNDAVSTIDRIRNMFPRSEQQSILDGLSRSLYLIQSQRLVPDEDGNIVPIVEIFYNSPQMQALIRDEKINQIHATLKMEKGQLPWDECLVNLVNQGKLSLNTALIYAKNREYLQDRLSW